MPPDRQEDISELKVGGRQWPEVYDCVTLFCTLRESENTLCTRNACNSRMSVYFLTRATCKNVRQNLIPRATA